MFGLVHTLIRVDSRRIIITGRWCYYRRRVILVLAASAASVPRARASASVQCACCIISYVQAGRTRTPRPARPAPDLGARRSAVGRPISWSVLSTKRPRAREPGLHSIVPRAPPPGNRSRLPAATAAATPVARRDHCLLADPTSRSLTVNPSRSRCCASARSRIRNTLSRPARKSPAEWSLKIAVDFFWFWFDFYFCFYSSNCSFTLYPSISSGCSFDVFISKQLSHAAVVTGSKWNTRGPLWPVCVCVCSICRWISVIPETCHFRGFDADFSPRVHVHSSLTDITHKHRKSFTYKKKKKKPVVIWRRYNKTYCVVGL